MSTFFAHEPITIMLSSRCSDKVSYQGKDQTLDKIRVAIKKKLEGIRLGEMPVFEVWIHEDESATSGDTTTWDTCMQKARQCDLFLMLYNGNAGWHGSPDPQRDAVGICHEEFITAHNQAPAKVRVIQFPEITTKPNSPDARFQRYVQNQKKPAPQVKTGEEAINKTVEAAISALLSMAKAGVGVSSKGSYFSGEALSWSRLDYAGRREMTRKTVLDFMRALSPQTKGTLPEHTATLKLEDSQVAFRCDCIPASFGTAAARELVGQPFLHDHEYCANLQKSIAGPVHLIACQKTVSENQALKQLGFPDALVVSAPFGIYVADNVQKIQMVFIANCRDETTTRRGTQRFIHWLLEEGEDKNLAARAVSRRKISNLIANELF